MTSIERLRQAIDGFLLGANDLLYGWRLRLVDLWEQGVDKWLLLLLVAALAAIGWLLAGMRRRRRALILLQTVTEGVGRLSSQADLLALAFRTIFAVTRAPAAGVYIAHAPGAPLLLQGKEDNPAVPESEHPEWDPRRSVDQAPASPVVTELGRLIRVTIPVALDGEPLALVEVGTATTSAAETVRRGADQLGLLVRPILGKVAAHGRIERLEERAREAMVVSGSSQAILSTTLGLDEQATMLLDLAVRATESDAGVILVDAAAAGVTTSVLASSGLHPHVRQSLARGAGPLVVSRPGMPGAEVTTTGPPVEPALAGAGFRSALRTPITVDGTTVGHLVLLRQDGGFLEHHRRVSGLHAARLAFGLKNRAFHAAAFGEYRATLSAMAATYESTGPHLRGHSRRVARLAQHLAGVLGASPAEVEGIGVAGELHDVGMVALGSDIVLRAGRLTTREYDLVKHHPAIGGALTAPIRMPVPIGPLVLHHHERFDGAGYPVGLAGTEIPLGARILALGEVFDAMVTARSYREALPFAQASTRLRSIGGSQLDPSVVEAFLATVTADHWHTIERDSREPE